MEQPNLSSIDLAVIAGYFIVVFVIGLWVARTTHDSDDLFLAGRKLLWPAIGLSLFASNISSSTLIGLAGAAYDWGIAVSNYEWMAALVMLFFVVFVAPIYIRSRISTVPEFLERRFDRRSRLYVASFTIFTNVVVDCAGGLYAGALVLKLFFPELDLFMACVGLAVAAGIYTAAGGLAAVVYTDMLQATILLVGSCMLTYYAFAEIDFSWTTMVSSVPDSSMHLMLPLDDPNLPWLGTLIGVPILGFYFWCTNQFISQRVLAAKDLKHARYGSLLAGALKLVVLFIMVLPGVIAKLKFPALERPDLVFPTMVVELLPVGVVGLVLAGLIAAIMSSVDSTLNSASAMVTLDFIKPNYPQLSSQATARIGRYVIVLFMAMCAAVAPLIMHFKGLFQYLQLSFAYLVPPAASVFLFGFFWKRATARGAFWGMVSGHVASAIVLATWIADIHQLHFTLVAGVTFGVCSLVIVGLSLLAPERMRDEAREVMYDAEWIRSLSPAVRGGRLYVALSVGLVVASAALIGFFW